MTSWLTGLMEAADKFLGESLAGWSELGMQRPPEFWVDQVHDYCHGDGEMSTTDDFNASSDGLGANWAQVYEGDGSSFMKRATDLQSIGWKQPEFSDGLTFYGSMPDSQGRTVGAKLRHDSTCTGCGKRFATGDCITAELAPDMGGTFHHTDCDDPTLAKVVDE